jgi:hypothetical protein
MFDLSNVESQKPQNTIPDDKYVCNVTEAKMKDTKTGGMMIQATLTIAAGKFKGRKIFTNFNVENANPKAVEIGLAQLKSLLETAGYPNPNKLGGVDELCGLRVGVKTKTRKDETYGDRTEVSYFLSPQKVDAKTPDPAIPF